jgi:Zn-dependent M32 family carboxypeptidase
MMPPGGARRGASNSRRWPAPHDLLVAPEVAEDLAAATAEGEWEGANLRLMRRAHRRATALPTSLVEAIARANSACEKVWREVAQAGRRFRRSSVPRWRRWCASTRRGPRRRWPRRCPFPPTTR